MDVTTISPLVSLTAMVVGVPEISTDADPMMRFAFVSISVMVFAVESRTRTVSRTELRASALGRPPTAMTARGS